jgi:hypothetical protein
MASTEKYNPLIFEDLDSKPNADINKTVVSVKADGRAWAFKKDMNYWYLVDVSVLNFQSESPIQVKVDNASVTYLIDIDTLNKPN